MQSDIKEICKLTSLRTKKSETVYKDIAYFVFKATHEVLKAPPKLITKLKGVGYWFLKRKRMLEVIGYYPSYYDIEGYNDFSSKYALLNFNNKKELYNTLKNRLEDYKKYLEKRELYKIKKYEFSKIPESKEEGDKSSENQPS